MRKKTEAEPQASRKKEDSGKQLPKKDGTEQTAEKKTAKKSTGTKAAKASIMNPFEAKPETSKRTPRKKPEPAKQEAAAPAEPGKKKLLFVGAEVMPFAATGGLGDVLGSLPTALASSGKVDVRVVMPLYSSVSEEWRKQMKLEAVTNIRLAWRWQYCGIFSLVKDGVTYYFIDNEYYFRRPALYGQYDDGERYAYFCMAVMEMMKTLDYYPNILHAHDWQAALSLVYLNCIYRSRPGYENIRTVYTIHNIEYQGQYDFAILGDVFSLGENEHSLMEYSGGINLMKAAIECADRVTTVSPRYAQELLTDEYSHGLRCALERNSGKLRGILNGIDYVYYDPQDGNSLAVPYSAEHPDGKREDKAAFQREVGLPVREDVPVLAVISRLAAHKGLDLIAECIYDIVSSHDIQLVVLGKGEERYERFFAELESRHPDKVRALITYDRELSKRIYAASDIFLMPSRSEPCGLSQMIASRYGSIPVVRETGGLYDSIKPFWMDGEEMRGNGFTFANYSFRELKERTEAAIALWRDPALRDRLMQKIMQTDFSWNASAEKYLEMYQEL